MSILNETDLNVTEPAHEKLMELIGQVDDPIEGIRVYAQAGGCSGISFGMTYTDSIEDSDLVREINDLKVVVGMDTIDHLRGAEIDFVDHGNGNATFVFNNIPAPTASACGTCGSQGGGCA